MIVLENVKKVYENNFLAVDDVSLQVKRGEIFGIIGLSGAGKSSLIRMLNGLEKQTDGLIQVEGIDISKLSKKKLLEKRKKIGMIFQHFNLLNSRTVRGNIEFALEIANWNKEMIDKRVDELLKLVELEDKSDFYPSQLSGGQKQRVAIARAIANEPEILLSDEATSALDPKTTKSILELIKNLQKKLKLTVVLITHQMEVIRDICDRVAVMSTGKIIEVGDTSDIFSNPKMDITKELVLNIQTQEEETIDLIKKKDKKIIKLIFLNSCAENPILSKVIKKYDIDVNILGGAITLLSNSKVGHLIIEMLGDMEKQNEAIAYFKNLGVTIEVIYDGI